MEEIEALKKQCNKLQQVIDLLKDIFKLYFHEVNGECYLRYTKPQIKELTKKECELLREAFIKNYLEEK